MKTRCSERTVRGYSDFLVRGVLVSSLLVVLTGCSRVQDGRLTTFRVTGKVLLNGQPAEGADVVFHSPNSVSEREIPAAAARLLNAQKGESAEAPATKHPYPTATVDAQGNFQLSTYRPLDGCPAGAFTVTVSLRKPTNPNVSDPDYGPEQFPPSYTQVGSSPLKIEIQGRTALPAFEIAAGKIPNG